MSQHALDSHARAVLALTMLALALLFGACVDEPRPPLEPAPVTAPPPSVGAPAPAPEPEVEPTADELPVADDFAAEAEQAIDAKSYRAELDALEKELSAETASAAP